MKVAKGVSGVWYNDDNDDDDDDDDQAYNLRTIRGGTFSFPLFISFSSIFFP